MQHAPASGLKLISSERSRTLDLITLGPLSYRIVREGADRDVYDYQTCCPFTGIVNTKRLTLTYCDASQSWEKSEELLSCAMPQEPFLRAA